VTCIVRKTSNLRWIGHLNLKYLYGDLGNAGEYEGELRKFDYIFHLAGLTKAYYEKDFFYANAECTRVLAAAAAGSASQLKRFLHVSSLAAAGPSLSGRPLTEESSPHPVSAYGRSKLEGEKAVLAFRDRIPVTIVRPPAVYGPRDTDMFLVFRAVQSGIFPYWGRCTYSLIYVEDLVKGLILAAEKDDAAGKTYYLADRRVYTNDEVLAALNTALGRKAFRLRLPRAVLPFLGAFIQKIRKKGIINPDKIREIRYADWTCDTGRAARDLGFHTETSLEEGFKTTADWYRKEKWL
jgi:nucleoside-diphosphate-sugar epimerase